jgi:outer membrane protein TolC
MNNLKRLGYFILLSSFFMSPLFQVLCEAEDSQPEILNLSQVLLRAEQFSPDLKASSEGERAGQQSVRIEQSLYYPTLDLTAVDSAGFPASANAPIGFNGVMSSPYRAGLSGGAYSTFTFFDLTREYGVKAAHLDLQSLQEETQVRRLQIDLQAMNLYMDAVLDLAQRDTWRRIQDEVDRLYGVVKKFVRNGQYSEVTTWLLKNQSEQALRKQEDFDVAYHSALRRIEINIGAKPDSVSVQGLSTLEPVFNELSRHHLPESPLLTLPQFQTKASQARTMKQSAQNYPRLFGIASAGAMEDSRLVPVQNFAGWIGLTFPIFEGFRISSEEERAKAQAERSADMSRQAQIELADSDIQFQQQTSTHQSDVKHYLVEREDAMQALNLAEHRYVTFVGDLADVRDSLYSYESAENGLNSAQVELYRSKLSLVIIDGGYLDQGSASN